MVDQAALDMETGHICYMAPERFNPETQASCWQTAIDVYAFACLCILVSVCRSRDAFSLMFFKVLTSRHPFQELYERSQYEVMFAVTRGSRPARPKYPECLFEPTEDVWTLIQHCWHQEPGDRPGMISVHQRLQRVSVHKTPCLRPKGHPDRASSCADLAISLFTSFEQHGDVTLLDEALDLQREALHLRPEEHPDHASSCASLATLLFTRFHRTKDMTLLDEALDLQRQALRLRPEGHPARASSCAGLATALFAGFEHTRNMALLDEAIKLQREVLNIRLEGHPDHAVSCNNLVTSLLSQFSTTKNPDLVEEALELTRKV
jgi:tetratricopeptide (TPR) repeat protein